MDHWSILLAYSAYPVILAALAPRIRFSLHKEFRDGEIRLYLHKEFRAAELGDDATENDNFQRGKQRLQRCKNFSRSFHFIFLMKNRGRCNRKCQKKGFAGVRKFQVEFWWVFFMKDRGAMRQKMSIFKGGNSVCRDAKISSWLLMNLQFKFWLYFVKFKHLNFEVFHELAVFHEFFL